MREIRKLITVRTVTISHNEKEAYGLINFQLTYALLWLTTTQHRHGLFALCIKEPQISYLDS